MVFVFLGGSPLTPHHMVRELRADNPNYGLIPRESYGVYPYLHRDIGFHHGSVFLAEGLVFLQIVLFGNAVAQIGLEPDAFDGGIGGDDGQGCE
jgi:hypothetical protein